MPPPVSAVHRYHDGTKHHFQRFARSVGYLDWASQPRPFRRFAGTPEFLLFPAPGASGPSYTPQRRSYDRLFDSGTSGTTDDTPLSAGLVGDLLRHALGLSAWKQYRESRWSLRVNPSSGNLHPTEAYVVCGPCDGLGDRPSVYHYAADRHALEQRCVFDRTAWATACSGDDRVVLVALTSIHWREAWKYGERAFRYCQHDLGHAVASISLAAAAVGWRAAMVPGWSHETIASLTGIDRDTDFVDAEREDPQCVIALGPGDCPGSIASGGAELVAGIVAGQWSGQASQLSEDHVQWTFIDEIAAATRDAGRAGSAGRERGWIPASGGERRAGRVAEIDARSLFIQRRSAVAFDGSSSISREAFLLMLARVMPGNRVPWDAVWWTPRLHLALFVHRVDGLEPGVYLLSRTERALDVLRRASDREFLWERVDGDLPLVCLARGDCRRLAQRLSCDQDIAADGFFSLGMIAEFDASLDEHGPSFYRHLFWESGVIGQVLYLEAEAAGARATGIGCFYDDPVHDVLGFRDHTVQSLYHFSMGIPVEDTRLTVEPGYPWETARRM